MDGLLIWLVEAGMPHAQCIPATAITVAILIADAGIAICYFAISAQLMAVRSVLSRVGISTSVLVLFAAFVFLCAKDHLMMVVNLYWPHYGWEAVFKWSTMLVSGYTVYVLSRDVVPMLLKVVKLAEETGQAERYRRTMDESPWGIIHFTVDRKVVEANPKLERMLGYQRGQMVGMTLDSLVHPVDLVETDRLFAAGFNDPEALRRGLPFKNRYRHNDGSWVPLCWHLDIEQYMKGAQTNVAIGFAEEVGECS